MTTQLFSHVYVNMVGMCVGVCTCMGHICVVCGGGVCGCVCMRAEPEADTASLPRSLSTLFSEGMFSQLYPEIVSCVAILLQRASVSTSEN